MRYIKSKFMLAIVLLVIAVVPTNISAEEASAEGSSSVYASPEIDKSLQIEGESYINYDVSKHLGETLDAKLKLSNPNNNDVKVRVSVRNGLTSASGEVYEASVENSYSGFVDESYIMEKYIAGLPETLEMKANEVIELDFQIKVPKNLKGRLIGGLGFNVANEKEDTNEEGLSINIESGYVFSIWLNAKDEKETPIKITNVDVDQEDRAPELIVKLENNNTNFFKDYDVEYEVINKSSGEMVFEGEEAVNIFSPKNFVKLPIGWDGMVLSGDYTININGESFDFELTEKEVDEMMQKADGGKNVMFTEKSTPLWMKIALGVLLILLLISWFRRKKDKDEEKIEDEKSDKDGDVNENGKTDAENKSSDGKNENNDEEDSVDEESKDD